MAIELEKAEKPIPGFPAAFSDLRGDGTLEEEAYDAGHLVFALRITR